MFLLEEDDYEGDLNPKNTGENECIEGKNTEGGNEEENSVQGGKSGGEEQEDSGGEIQGGLLMRRNI